MRPHAAFECDLRANLIRASWTLGLISTGMLLPLVRVSDPSATLPGPLKAIALTMPPTCVFDVQRAARLARSVGKVGRTAKCGRDRRPAMRPIHDEPELPERQYASAPFCLMSRNAASLALFRADQHASVAQSPHPQAPRAQLVFNHSPNRGTLRQWGMG
jgi:hypothetical protein